MTTLAILHIIENDSRYLAELLRSVLAAFRSWSCLDECMLLDEEATASLLSGETMAKLRVAALVSHLLLDAGAASRLTTDRLRANYFITVCGAVVDADLMDLIDCVVGYIRRCWHLGALRRRFLQASSMACGSLSIDSVLARH